MQREIMLKLDHNIPSFHPSKTEIVRKFFFFFVAVASGPIKKTAARIALLSMVSLSARGVAFVFWFRVFGGCRDGTFSRQLTRATRLLFANACGERETGRTNHPAQSSPAQTTHTEFPQHTVHQRTDTGTT